MFLRQRPRKLPAVALVNEGVVVSEFDEWVRPDVLDAADLLDDPGDRLHPEGRRDADRARAELAAERAAALRLHRQPVVALDVEQLEARHRRLAQVELPAPGVIASLQRAALEVGDERRPRRLALANDDCVGVALRLQGPGGDVQSAQDDAGAERAVAVREPVGLADLRAEARDRDGIKLARDAVDRIEIGHIDVFNVDVPRRHAGKRQQSEARQRRDHLAALDEPGQRETQIGERLVVGAHAAHCDEADSHESPPRMNASVAPSRLRTGSGKR